jgi:hypothetical protein
LPKHIKHFVTDPSRQTQGLQRPHSVSPPPRRQFSAHFVEETDACRAAELLDPLFETLTALTGRAGDNRRWLLTVVLPTEPSLATLYVDEALRVQVEKLLEQHGGEILANERVKGTNDEQH